MFKLFKKKKADKDTEYIPLPPGTNGYAALVECPYCKKTFAKTSLFCEFCNKQVFDK